MAPADIQVFTNETKEKLRARCNGKTVKIFIQAIEQICTAFDEKQNKSNKPSPPNYPNKPTDHEINAPLCASNLISTSDMKVEFHERALKTNNGKHMAKPKHKTKPESSEKEEEVNLVLTKAKTEDEICKFPKDEEDREIAKKKENEAVDIVIALGAPVNRKRGRDMSATDEGLSMQARKKTAREGKNLDFSDKGVGPSKEALKESTREVKSRDLSEGSLLMKSRGLNGKSASLRKETLQVNTNDKKDNGLPVKGLKGRALFKKSPETATEALSGKVSKTNTEAPHKEAKLQSLSENGIEEENVNVPKEISRINNESLEEKVQETKMRDLSEKRQEMESSAKKKLSSSGPIVKKHQLGAEETPSAVKRPKLVDRSVPSSEKFRNETKLDTHASENSERKRGLVKRSCLFNEGEEAEGKRTPVHRKAPLKLENQKKAPSSPQRVKVPEKRGEKVEMRSHGNKHVNSEPRTVSLFHVKSTQEKVRVDAKPTHEKDPLLTDR